MISILALLFALPIIAICGALLGAAVATRHRTFKGYTPQEWP